MFQIDNEVSLWSLIFVNQSVTKSANLEVPGLLMATCCGRLPLRYYMDTALSWIYTLLKHPFINFYNTGVRDVEHGAYRVALAGWFTTFDHGLVHPWFKWSVLAITFYSHSPRICYSNMNNVLSSDHGPFTIYQICTFILIACIEKLLSVLSSS